MTEREPVFATRGAELIVAERERQVNAEHWTPEHDDGHTKGEIALAAATYALPEETREASILGRSLRLFLWPWDTRWWKPGRAPYSDPERADPTEQRVHELVKAGALIAAEIDRLHRAANRQEPTS